MDKDIWLQNAKKNLICRSVGTTLPTAMQEWEITGNSEDRHAAIGVCQLCEHEGLRYHFEISNTTTSENIWVGSSCIAKFIPMVDNGKEVVGEESKMRVLNRRILRWEAQSRLERANVVLDEWPPAMLDFCTHHGKPSGNWVTASIK